MILNCKVYTSKKLRVMPAAVNHASQAVIFQDYHSIKRKIAGLTVEFKKKKCSGKGLK